MAENIDFPEVLKKSFDSESESLKVSVITSLIPNVYDSIELSYTGDDLTEVVYKAGGSTIATLNLSYLGGKLVEVQRS